MTKTLILPALLRDCPDYWKKFADQFDDWPDMRKELEQTYHARLAEEFSDLPDVYDDLVIEFEQEKYLSLFLMRYA